MFFHGLPASAMYYREQRISSLYWRGMRIWQANAESGPLREGQLVFEGFDADFEIVHPHLLKGELNLTGFNAILQQVGILNDGQLILTPKTVSFNFSGVKLNLGALEFVRKSVVFYIKNQFILGNLYFHRQTATFYFRATLNQGNLNLNRFSLTTQQKVILANRILNIHGNAATLSLIAPAWHDFFSVSLSLNNASWNGFTVRQRVEAAAITSPGGSSSRVTFKAASTGAGVVLAAAYIGQGAPSGNAYAFNSTPTQLLFSGAANKSFAVNTSVVSDSVAYAPQSGEAMVISMYFNGNTDLPYVNGISNFSSFYKVANDPATVAASGYTTFVSNCFVSKVEGS